MIDEVKRILARHDFDSGNIEKAPGFANAVVMTSDTVIRLNGGRFVNAFAHEADALHHLQGVIPVPSVIASGERDTGGEYIILERLRGQNLEDAWPQLSTAQRSSVLDQLAVILRTIHSLPIQPWMICEWVDRALDERDAANAYHAPPEHASWLVESARQHRPDLVDTLPRVSAFVTDRMNLFNNNRDVFIHSDLHFRNIIVDGETITGIIDFEGCRPAPLDVELDMLVRWLAPQAKTNPNDYAGLLPALFHHYPAFGNIPALLDRLEVMELLWMLVQAHHWQSGAAWMSDPGVEMRRVLDGAFRADLVQAFPVLTSV